VPPEYGFMSALQFALPGVRQQFARRVRDSLTQAVATYRNAEYFVLAHSNGTYALADALFQYEGIRLNRVVLAGSVLPTQFDWSVIIGRKQVVALRNDRAARDWPVGALCSALRGLGMRDVGTAGVDGFLGSATKEVCYYPGGHGDMLLEPG